MQRPSGQTVFLAAAISISAAMVAYVLLTGPAIETDAMERDASETGAAKQRAPIDGDRAYAYLKEICEIGPRPSGSQGMQRQQQYLVDFFTKAGGDVHLQRFQARHPLNGQPVPMANLIVEWNPDAKERILLCAHYDTRPFPDRDPRNPNGTFVGANDGASGVAALMELAHHIGEIDSKYGVDFVLFDAEELVYRRAFRDVGTYFLGSEFFARQYVQNRQRGVTYRWGVLLDMVGDADLQLYFERNSIRWPDTRPLVKDIWETARDLDERAFVHRIKHEIRDDHIKLHDVGGIPTCDIIDFDYPYWHTEGDTADKCSGDSLETVVWVLYNWLQRVE